MTHLKWLRNSHLDQESLKLRRQKYTEIYRDIFVRKMWLSDIKKISFKYFLVLFKLD